jgi:hypothetical protein
MSYGAKLQLRFSSFNFWGAPLWAHVKMILEIRVSLLHLTVWNLHSSYTPGGSTIMPLLHAVSSYEIHVCFVGYYWLCLANICCCESEIATPLKVRPRDHISFLWRNLHSRLNEFPSSSSAVPSVTFLDAIGRYNHFREAV